VEFKASNHQITVEGGGGMSKHTHREGQLCKARTPPGTAQLLLGMQSALQQHVGYDMQPFIFLFAIQLLCTQEEGIMVKDLTSKWIPRDRTGAWMKLKPDHAMCQDIDAVIIGVLPPSWAGHSQPCDLHQLSPCQQS